MEELKARNIIENLESIAAEKGTDALTGEIIEECCRTNGADPEDFKNFICENIDLQKIKELQGSEELLPEKLGQVAGGARPVKQGMASFLAATSLLGSAANFTVSAGNDALANAKRDIHTAQLIDLQKSVEQKNRRNKKKQSAWTRWDILKCMGLGSFATCASAIAYWAHSQKNSKDPQRGSPEEGIYSPVGINGECNASNEEIYAQFSKLLDEFEAADVIEFCDKINKCGFVKTASAISSFTNQQGGRMVITSNFSSLDKAEIKAEIGEENIAKLKGKLEYAHKQYLKYLDKKSSASSSWDRGFAQAGPESSSSSSSQSQQPDGSKYVWGEVPGRSSSSGSFPLEKVHLTGDQFEEFYDKVIENARILSTIVEDTYYEIGKETGAGVNWWNTNPDLFKAFLEKLMDNCRKCKFAVNTQNLKENVVKLLDCYLALRTGDIYSPYEYKDKLKNALVVVTCNQIQQKVELDECQNNELQRGILVGLKLSPQNLRFESRLQNIYDISAIRNAAEMAQKRLADWGPYWSNTNLSTDNVVKETLRITSSGQETSSGQDKNIKYLYHNPYSTAACETREDLKSNIIKYIVNCLRGDYGFGIDPNVYRLDTARCFIALVADEDNISPLTFTQSKEEQQILQVLADQLRPLPTLLQYNIEDIRKAASEAEKILEEVKKSYLEVTDKSHHNWEAFDDKMEKTKFDCFSKVKDNIRCACGAQYSQQAVCKVKCYDTTKSQIIRFVLGCLRDKYLINENDPDLCRQNTAMYFLSLTGSKMGKFLVFNRSPEEQDIIRALADKLRPIF